jgi:hypothetical protein
LREPLGEQLAADGDAGEFRQGLDHNALTARNIVASIKDRAFGCCSTRCVKDEGACV